MKLSIERQVTVGFALALLMVGGIGLASWHSSREFVADAAAIQHAQEILTRLESLLSTMTDAETGQREFTVTGDERFLEPSGPVDVPRDPLTLGRFPTW